MAASYPSAIKSFSAVVNGITKLVAALFNSPYEEITAMQTELGTDPAGSYTDVKTRLNSTTTFAARVDKSASFGAQQAATDGLVEVYASETSSNTNIVVLGYTDSNSNPTTLKHGFAIREQTDYQGLNHGNFTMAVKRGDYWKVTRSGTPGAAWVVDWIPIGS